MDKVQANQTGVKVKKTREMLPEETIEKSGKLIRRIGKTRPVITLESNGYVVFRRKLPIWQEKWHEKNVL